MIFQGVVQIALFLALLVATVPLLGGYMARVFEGKPVPIDRLLKPAERLVYRICAINPGREQHWSTYTASMLAFNLLGMLFLYALVRLQYWLPLNPAGLPGVSPALSFNLAVSFVTNTDWQAFSGEQTLSILSQMLGVTAQNFLSAATGLAVLLALVRGFSRRSCRTIGNFYVDVVRCTLYVLLPLALALALFMVWQGTPQVLASPATVFTLEGVQQKIPEGPVASQVAIKQLGSNGGGYFNANAAHPFENPTPLSNFVQCWAILGIAAALTFTFGRMVGDARQGWAIFKTMLILFMAGLAATLWFESRPNPLLANPLLAIGGIDQQAGNMEGKEVRFGVAASALWASATTAASNGSVNAMHDSFTPLGGLVLMVNMQLGEVVFGGVGAGLYGMLVFVILTVFIAGLMVGRTPEYLGKKIESREIKLAVMALLVVPVGVLGFGALSIAFPAGAAAISQPGPHGLSQLLYAYSSAVGNNGSAFAGFDASNSFQACMLGLVLMIGRYFTIIPLMAIAGSLAAKKMVPPTAGTMPTHGALFIGMVIGVILIVGGLTFFPVLALGPVLEHLAMIHGKVF
ncbi:MAG: potassium-transporting ATPase subunit KdpA [Rhodospirillaceae bacterium]